MIANRTDITWTPIRNNDISWNFSKWLIDHNGQPFRRYTPRTTPQQMRDDVEELLKACGEDRRDQHTTEGKDTTKNTTESGGAATKTQTTKKKRTLVWT